MRLHGTDANASGSKPLNPGQVDPVQAIPPERDVLQRRAAAGSRRRLFVLIYLIGIVVTTVLSNDATAVVLTPAVYAAARAARASVNGEPLRLTSLEYRLLHYLMMHQGRVISRTELVEHLYDQDFDRDSNTIEVFVGRIRKKLDVDIIQTVRGLGYLLTPPTAGA